MIISGCLTAPLKETEALQESKRVLDEAACQVPAIYLVECRELEGYEEGDLMSVYETTKKNNEKSNWPHHQKQIFKATSIQSGQIFFLKRC